MLFLKLYLVLISHLTPLYFLFCDSCLIAYFTFVVHIRLLQCICFIINGWMAEFQAILWLSITHICDLAR